MLHPPTVRIPVPVRAADPPPPGFPLIAMLAPIAVSGVLFAITGSPLMLVMAGFGPLVALATFLDGRRQRRRSRRHADARFADELTRARDAVRAAHEAERLRRASFASVDPDWAPRDGPPVVAIARGVVASGVELSGTIEPDAPADLRNLHADASTLASAPELAQLAGAVMIDGPAVLAAAVAGTLVLRLAARLSPVEAILEAPPAESWVRDLPHETVPALDGVYRWRWHDDEVVIAGAGSAEPGARVVRATEADATSRASARRTAQRLADAARAAGLRSASGAIPESVDLASLLELEQPGSERRGLAAPLGVTASGVLTLDLVTDGPHAIVAGMTGSGKSELLVSWVLGMAHGRSPAEVAFVLVDFKGGAAFAPLAGLPHVVGTLSDLDERLARRAIESLRAEVLRRERVLAGAGVRAIDELVSGALARLVVVVDEFAALLAERSDLHALFADLAARGRSLGIHLVLCTQRPAGVVRDAVLANIAVRVALRVADRGDSIGLVGDDAAARLPATPRGRAVVVDGAGERRTAQIALASSEDIARITDTTPRIEVARPWCDPLPAVVPFAALPAPEEGLAFGLLDLPAEQRQPAATLTSRDGHVLVLGATGSGRSTALAAFAEAARGAARWLPRDPVELWAVLADPALIPDHALVLLDDLDLTLARADPDHGVEFVDLMGRLLREAPRRGIRVVASARHLAPPLTSLVSHFGSRLMLRMASRDEHVVAGGEGSTFDARAQPGAGVWGGAVVQVALPPDAPRIELEAPAPVVVEVPARGELAVVAARPRDVAQHWEPARVRVRFLGALDDGEVQVDPGCTVWLGDPDAWQADWATLTRVRRDLPLVVVGCSVSELRALTRSRDVPPPLRPGEVWLVEHGRVRRAVLAPVEG